MVVADELLPSVTANLELGRARGFVTDHGGSFSHSSILARSMGTPGGHRHRRGGPGHPHRRSGDRRRRVGRGVRESRAARAPGVRPAGGRVPQPTARGCSSWSICRRSPRTAPPSPCWPTSASSPTPRRRACTRRGHRALPDRVRFLGPDQPPHRGRAVRVPGQGGASGCTPRPINFRLLDLGGDKQLSYFPLPASRNPSLADRGIRLLLKHPALLKAQLRAFLRVSADPTRWGCCCRWWAAWTRCARCGR